MANNRDLWTGKRLADLRFQTHHHLPRRLGRLGPLTGYPAFLPVTKSS